MAEHTLIVPGDTVGILGGGQLARMLAIAAAQLGLKAHVYAPAGDNPAFAVADAHTIASYDDPEALATFARQVAVVTYEFENVPADTVDALTPHAPVRPSGRALAVTQDRLTEKTFVRDLGFPTATFAAVDFPDDLRTAAETVGLPAILKTRRFGYDGKGQARVEAGLDPVTVFATLNQACILEGVVPFVREVSVIVARALNGETAVYDVCENRHREGILRTTTLPAGITPATVAAAQRIALEIATALDYVGVLAVEMFVSGTGEHETLTVNEMAPRVHNSGHWTIEGAATSQFTQHIRAICGWPLGSTGRLGDVEMRNIIGDEAQAWRDHLAEAGTALHLYGKAEARPGRKMGHVTHVRPTGRD